ncbi:ABC transporter permease [Marivibrio halodurans]|uniref:ABC transporter permease n=1 Tax=Marivibrio halodurans TaxID=2039722 RepID=A0A8J7V4S6_9PROT|nr:ABC transporter permease [Marivibrio halodurans]MBP5858004.1 ABC transporter permease [Marivibrio halodurans]
MSGGPLIRRLWHARRHPSLAIGAGLTALVLLAALVAMIWTPYPVDGVDATARLGGPGLAHPLGTDHFGRDVLSLILAGARTSVAVGLVAVGLGLGLGVPLGLIAALTRVPLVDAGVGRLADLIFAFPAVLSAVLITAIHGPGAVNVIVAVGIFNIAVFARVARGAAIGVAAQPFVIAARAMGRRGFSTAMVHVLPNIAGILIVQATIQFAVAILAEAGLSYLGLGVQPPQPSWGKMLADSQTFMFAAPLQAVFPGLAIMLSVLGLNLLGDGLRDTLDPRLKILRTA